jgi:hypothetical protein
MALRQWSRRCIQAWSEERNVQWISVVEVGLFERLAIILQSEVLSPRMAQSIGEGYTSL